MRIKQILGVVALFFLAAAALQGAFLVNHPISVTQPGGETLALLVTGDEYYHWVHDKNDYTIVRDPVSGYFVYAIAGADGEPAPSSFIAGRVDPAAVGLVKGVRRTSLNVRKQTEGFLRASVKPYAQPTAASGNINNIVVFIRFSGENEYTDLLSTYSTKFNATTSGATSMKAYFLEASYDKLSVTTTFYPPAAPSGTVVSYQDANTRNYYQPYDATTNPNGYQGGDLGDERTIREHTLLKNAVNAIASQVPAGLNLDSDGDGYVDNVCFIIYGNADAWRGLLWPHMWALYKHTVYLNGKRVWNYNFQLQGALSSSSVLCHEMGHSLGAPDLYHYSFDGLNPVYRWDVMAYNANPPQHMGAYMKYKYMGWIGSIPEITAAGTYTINSITSSSNNAYKIKSPNSTTEFFVVEYRQKTGTFESSLYGSGLLVYRINTNEYGNDDGPPDEIYIYRPDGTTTEDGSPLLAFFSSAAGRTAINDSTNPSCFLANGSAGGLDLSSIGAAGSTISFTVAFPVTPTITVTSPNGGENWSAGTTHDVTWTSTGTVGNVRLEYSTNNGSTWNTIIASTANDGSYAWPVPAVSSSACKVRILETADGSPSDMSNAVFTILKDRPIFSLSKDKYNFASVKNGKTTPADSVVISNKGGGTMKWTAVTSEPWLVVAPKSGGAGKTMKIKVLKLSGLTVGLHTATITLTDPNAANSPATISVRLVIKAEGTDAVPVGEFDDPANGATVRTATTTVSGWALDDVGMKSAKIYRKVTETKKALVGTAKFIVGARPDIETAYTAYPQNHRAGWSYTLKMAKLPNKGIGTFVLMAYIYDLAGHEVLLGSHTITGVAPSAGAAVPFGSLDAPEDGATISGSACAVSGWALAPPPRTIAEKGGLAAWIDGQFAGYPSYGGLREEIALAYPGFANSAAAGGALILDTTKYADGWHTLAWSATDSSGEAGAIGSLYFRIQNGAPAAGLSGVEAFDREASPVIGDAPAACGAFSELAAIPEDGRTPVFLKRGFCDEPPGEAVFPETDGVIRIAMARDSRLGLSLNQDSIGDGGTQRYQAYALIGEELRPMPIGCSFDAGAGVLFWQPGPGFRGEHQFILVDTLAGTRKTVKVTMI